MVATNPNACVKGQWRTDFVVVIGFQLELFHAVAVADDDRILDLARLYDGFPEHLESVCGPVNTVVGYSTRNFVETVRRAADDVALVARPPPALLDASVFPVELPEAADFPLHDSAQLLLSEVLPLIRSVIDRARQTIQAYLAQSQLMSIPQVGDLPE